MFFVCCVQMITEWICCQKPSSDCLLMAVSISSVKWMNFSKFKLLIVDWHHCLTRGCNCNDSLHSAINEINVKNDVYRNGYTQRSCTSKTAKIYRFVTFVMYCSITTVPVAFYWACSDDTVHYESGKTVEFCGFRCATMSPITISINVVFYISICCFLFPCMPKLNACNIP